MAAGKSRKNHWVRSSPDNDIRINTEDIVTLLECREAAHSRVAGSNSGTADENRQVFLDFLHTIPFGDIIIYSDGSKQLNGLGGAGFIGYQGGVQVLHKGIALGKGVGTFDT